MIFTYYQFKNQEEKEKLIDFLPRKRGDKTKVIKKFDKEYSTQYTPEMKYLQSKGINYSFVKEIEGVTTYKYTKTPELFLALVSFYMENK